MNRNRILSILVAILLISVSVLAFSACSDDGITTAIKSAEITKDGMSVKLKATLDSNALAEIGGGKIFLLALDRYGDTLDKAEVLAQKSPQERMTFEFSLYDAGGDSRLTSAFLLATGHEGNYIAVTEEYYISNPEQLSEISIEPNPTGSIKGFDTSDIYGAHILGAEHSVIDARIDHLMLSSHTEDSVRFNHEGVTYFFDAKEVEALDKLVQDADRVGMRVYLRTVLGNDTDKNSIDSLYHSGKGNATYYLPNMSDAKAVRHLNAFYAFLASRYPVCDYIIGEKVNYYSEYCNSGEASAQQFVDEYLAWLRSSHLTLRSVNSYATVYLAADDYWKIDTNDGHIGTRAFLEKISAQAKMGGDFEYAIAVNIGSAEDLADLLAGNEYDYSRLGAANLSDLTDLLDKEAMLFDESRRRLIIDGLAFSDGTSEENRAAYYTYAYYSATSCGINAFILEGDTSAPNLEDLTSHYAFTMCGTDKTAQLSDYADLFPSAGLADLDDHKTIDLFYASKALTDIDARIMEKENKYKITMSDFDFGGSVTNLQGVFTENADGDSSRMWVIESDTASGVGGVTLSGISAKDFIRSAYIGITVSGKDTSKLVLTVMNDDKQNVDAVFVGEMQLSDDQATYYFYLTDFVKTVKKSDSLTLSLCVLAEDESDTRVEISDISLLGESQAGSSSTVVVIVVAAVAAMFIALIVVLAVRRKKKRSPKNAANGNNKD